MGKTTLIRPDGSTIQADETNVDVLRTLGYKDQTPEAEAGAAVAKSTEDYYTTGAQKALTATEGLLGGATLGLSDLAFEHMGFDTGERAGYNPGIRLGTELVGGFAALGPLGDFTPAGLLSKGSKAAAEALVEGKAARTVVAGALEGGGFGGGSAISNAALNGDPLTAEAVMAGVGWGGVFGGGFGAISGKITSRIEAKAAEREALEEAQASMMRETHEAWGTFRGAVNDTVSEIKTATKAADESVKNVTEAVKSATTAKDTFLNERIAASQANQNMPGAEGMYGSGFKKASQAASKAYGEARAAARAGDFTKAQAALGKFKEATTEIAQMHGLPAPELSGFADMSASRAFKAADEVAKLGAVEKHLNSFAVNPEEFATMTEGKAEKVFAAVDSAMKLGGEEFAGVREGLKNGIGKLQEALGVSVDGSPATQLRGVWEAMKQNTTKQATEDVAKAAAGIVPWLKRAGAYNTGRMASKAAQAAGAGSFLQSAAYEAGKNMAHGIMGIKAAIVGGIAKQAAEWSPKLAKALSVTGPHVEPLKTRLDGTVDLKKKSRAQLMEDRAKEIRDAAGSVKDSLYKSVSPLSEYHPELAGAVYNLGVEQFKFLMDKLPRDPGQAFNKLQSIWKPDPVTMEKFARYYEVFQNPVGVMSRALKTGSITPEAAEGLREMHPAMFAQLRVVMLERLSDPKVMAGLSYNQQVGLGTLLNIPMHSSMSPQFVASQQQMYTQRQQLIPMPTQPGASGGGRPAGPASENSGATQSQRITEH